MRTSGVLLLIAGLPAWCGNWNPRQAADYLDARQKAWFAWPVAKAAGGTCVSCHTSMTYLMARPALRKLLGEAEPTQYETGLLDGMRERTEKNESMFGKAAEAKGPVAAQAKGVESILTALLLARNERPGSLSAVTRQAFDQMWAVQNREGAAKGAWSWFELKADPWEMPDSAYYGAALAALAVGATPASYREAPDVRSRIGDLVAYLKSSQQGQPLHNRLMLLWVSGEMPDAFPKSDCTKLVEEALGKQQPDGGWTVESLGPWPAHSGAPTSSGSSAYATAAVAVALEQAALPEARAGLSKALNWLRSHQDPAGYWDATSMNKVYAEGSMQQLFMRDAATALASLALAHADLSTRDMASVTRGRDSAPLR